MIDRIVMRIVVWLMSKYYPLVDIYAPGDGETVAGITFTYDGGYAEYVGRYDG